MARGQNLEFVATLQDNFTSKWRGVNKNATDGLKRFGKVAALSFTAAAAATTAFVNKYQKVADRIAKSAASVDLSVETYHALGQAFKEGGGNAQQFSRAMQRFTRSAGEAVQGTGEGASAFRELGVSVFDAEGNVRSTEDVLRSATTAISQMDSQSQKAAAAADLFGRNWAPVLATFKDGGVAIDQATASMQLLGAEITAEDTSRLEKWGDEWARVGVTFEALGVRLASTIAEALDFLPKSVQILTTTMSNVGKRSGEIWDAAKGLFTGGTEDFFDRAKQAGADAVKLVGEEFQAAGDQVTLYYSNLEKAADKYQKKLDELTNKLNDSDQAMQVWQSSLSEGSKDSLNVTSKNISKLGGVLGNFAEHSNTAAKGQIVASTAAGISRQFADLPIWLAIPNAIFLAANAVKQLQSVGTQQLAGFQGSGAQTESGIQQIANEQASPLDVTIQLGTGQVTVGDVQQLGDGLAKYARFGRPVQSLV